MEKYKRFINVNSDKSQKKKQNLRYKKIDSINVSNDLGKLSIEIKRGLVKLNRPKSVQDLIPTSGRNSTKNIKRFEKPQMTESIKSYKDPIENKPLSVLIEKQLEGGIKRLFYELDSDQKGKISVKDLNSKCIFRQIISNI